MGLKMEKKIEKKKSEKKTEIVLKKKKTVDIWK